MREEFTNPYFIQTVDEATIINEINLLIANLTLEKGYDRLQKIVSKVQTYADLMFLIGECIARKKLSFEELKANINISESKYLYQARKTFVEQNPSEKAPAISYFEALAMEYVKDDKLKLAKLNSELTRFKNAYESYDHKINALKKELEIVKYQESAGIVYG